MQRTAGFLLRAFDSLHVALKCVRGDGSWKRMESVMRASYFHNNYATNASDTRTRYSFGGPLSEGQSKKFFKSKIAYPTAVEEVPQVDKGLVREQSIGKHISREEKKKFLVNTLLDLKDSKEVVYGTLDAWVAWEQNFPLVLLKRALLLLEKDEQWHRIVQVIKWMLSKGQGTTMGTYEQLICALEKDNRAEEAHNIWVKKVSYDLQSVPWRFCDLMLSIYYRNNMPERLVKLFKDIESFGRKPPSKSIVRKVVDAYELLGSTEEKNRILQKYDDLFNSSSSESSGKLRKFSRSGIAAGRKGHTDKKAINRSSKGAPLDSGARGRKLGFGPSRGRSSKRLLNASRDNVDEAHKKS